MLSGVCQPCCHLLTVLSRPLVGETHLGPSPRREGLKETHLEPREGLQETQLGEEAAFPGEEGVMLAAPPPATRARSYDVLNNCADYQVSTLTLPSRSIASAPVSSGL